MMFRSVPGDGQPVEQTYNISIPFTENGVTKYRTETRTRTVVPMKTELKPVLDGTYFQDLAGKKLDAKDVVSKIPKAGRQVIVITDNNMKDVPPEWKELFNENVIIMRTRIQQ